MDKILYEVTYRVDYELAIPFIILLVSSCIFIGEIKAIRFEKTTKGHGVKLFIGSCGILVGLFACGVVVTSQIDMYQNIVVAYEDEQYKTVEGYVEDFVPMPAEGHAHETFQINGIEFDYSDNTALQGYNNTRVFGGVVTGNGQHLKVRYIYYEPWDCNVIVYIEETVP